MSLLQEEPVRPRVASTAVLYVFCGVSARVSLVVLGLSRFQPTHQAEVMKMSKMNLASKRRVMTTRAAATATIAVSHLLNAILVCSLRFLKPFNYRQKIFQKLSALAGAWKNALPAAPLLSSCGLQPRKKSGCAASAKKTKPSERLLETPKSCLVLVWAPPSSLHSRTESLNLPDCSGSSFTGVWDPPEGKAGTKNVERNSDFHGTTYVQQRTVDSHVPAFTSVRSLCSLSLSLTFSSCLVTQTSEADQARAEC